MPGLKYIKIINIKRWKLKFLNPIQKYWWGKFYYIDRSLIKETGEGDVIIFKLDTQNNIWIHKLILNQRVLIPNTAQ